MIHDLEYHLDHSIVFPCPTTITLRDVQLTHIYQGNSTVFQIRDLSSSASTVLARYQEGHLQPGDPMMWKNVHR